MRGDILKLARIAQKPERLIVGLMSGTSMDGLDVALCRLSGNGEGTRIAIAAFTTCHYETGYTTHIRQVFSKRTVDLCTLTLLNPWVAEVHARMVLSCLEAWEVEADEVDLIASHGQTIYHAPVSLHGRSGFANATLQIGDGDHLAVRTGIAAVHDFRQKHIAAGGEGAPLAAYGDLLVLASEDEDRVLLNMGGIANLTFLPMEGPVLTTDTGPGNTIMDALAMAETGLPYDEHGRLAQAGQVHEGLLKALLSDPFFQAPMPKTTGPELFNLHYLKRAQRISSTEALGLEDRMATLAAFSAASVCQAIDQVDPEGTAAIYASGGGAHNPALRAGIEKRTGRKLANTGVLGIDPDAKEAALMALLANECVCGDPLTSTRAAGMPSVTMGKISLPG